MKIYHTFRKNLIKPYALDQHPQSGAHQRSLSRRNAKAWNASPKQKRGSGTPEKKKGFKGEEHINSQGRKGEIKQVRPVDCRWMQCTEKINEVQWENPFNSYYSLASNERQKGFICTSIQTKETRTYLNNDKQPAAKKRQVYHQFSFVIDGTRVPVCKPFFTKTLYIGHGNIKTAMDNCVNEHFAGEDGRGKNSSANKLPESTRQAVRNHIAKFPAVESHYCKKKDIKTILGSKS